MLVCVNTSLLEGECAKLWINYYYQIQHLLEGFCKILRKCIVIFACIDKIHIDIKSK